MKKRRRDWHTLAPGIIVAGLGLLCLFSGVLLLAWRLLKPETAVLLPPGLAPPLTPTPGILYEPLAPPPLPDQHALVVILPVSERPTPLPTLLPTAARQPTVTPDRPATPLPSPSPTARQPTGTETVTVIVTATPTVTPTVISTVTPTLPRTKTPPPGTPTPPAVPDRVVIRAINLDAPVVPVGQHALKLGNQVYSQWDVPDVYAVGWHQNSALTGQAGNTVLNGHHNVYGEVFRRLIDLEPGDIVTLETQGTRFFYIVAQTMTLAEEGQPVDARQANARWILPTDDERVTLITCWPYESNTHRLVVIALPLAALEQTVPIP